tara:strand:+ start:337 stop:639 length:303 start_codon:yes stop_codon:yes gene_type:complete
MRVKIAYTVDISEVEGEVKNLLSEALSNIEKLHKGVLFAYNNLETLRSPLQEILESLEQSRKDMLLADSKVSDCFDIIDGYANVLKQLEKEKEQNEDEQT